MFAMIKSFFVDIWAKVKSIFSSFFMPQCVMTDQEKYDFVVYLLKGQNNNKGFALRHVSDDQTRNTNIKQGFYGDAVSYSVTSLIMSSVLNEKINTCSWHITSEGEVSYIADTMVKPLILDYELAGKIFDCIREKMLQFIKLNYHEGIHHFMLIKNMDGAVTPYDIKEIYPTGKCGKQHIKASQIMKVVSKNEQLSSPEKMLHQMEVYMLKSARSKQHNYDQGSTIAILNLLREINFNANDSVLKIDEVRKRLIDAELQCHWSDTKYHEFYDQGGYVDKLTATISYVNDDLDYFRSLI